MKKKENSEHGTAAQFHVPVPSSEPQLSGFGVRLAAALGKISENRQEQAAAAGVSDDTLVRYVDGRSVPKLTTAVAICEAAGVSLDWLVYGVEDAAAARVLCAGEDAGRYQGGMTDVDHARLAACLTAVLSGRGIPDGECLAGAAVTAYRMVSAGCSLADVRSLVTALSR